MKIPISCFVSKISVVLAVVLGLCSEARAASYYVDSVAGSDGNAGTSLTVPYRSLVNINNRAFQPGDIIYLKMDSSFSGGLSITASGNATSPITFKSYGTGATKPTISNNIAYGSYSRAVFLSSSASYIVLDGLKLTNASEAGVRIETGSTHNVVQNCEITNCGEGGLIKGQYNLVQYNYVHDLVMVVNDTGAGKTDNDYGATGFVIAGSDNEFRYNEIIDCRAPSYDYGYDGGAFEIYGGPSIPVLANISIHHNWMEGCIGVLESGASQIQGLGLFYNVSLNNSGFITLHTGGAFAGTISGVRIENNTVVELTTSANYSNLVYLDAVPTAAQFVFRNNIVVLGPNPSFNPVTNTGSDAVFKIDVPRNNNLYQFMSTGNAIHILNNWSNSLGAGELLNADPQFASTAAGQEDFNLSPFSAAIGAGTAVGLTGDYEGMPVDPVSPSMGAYESRNPVVRSADFNAYATGALPTSWSSGTWASASNTSTAQTLVTLDSANLYGQGAANKFLSLSSTALSSSGYGLMTNTLGASTPAGSVSFAFYQPVVANATGHGFILRMARDTGGNASTAFGFALKNGGLYLTSGSTVNLAATPFATYGLGQKHIVAVYFNNHATHSYLYAVGSAVYTVAVGQMDVWLDGVRVGVGLGKAGGLATGVDLGECNFAAQTNFIGTLYIDDFVVTAH